MAPSTGSCATAVGTWAPGMDLERVDPIRKIEQTQARIKLFAQRAKHIIKQQQDRLEHNRRFLDSLRKAD